MKIYTYIVSIAIISLLASCSPRVDDIFDGSAIERLTEMNATKKKLLTSAPNGWVLQYFPQTGAAASDSAKHQGYTFLMQFNDDGSVIIGKPVDGMFKTESSMWDIIEDNSTVLTFNTFNHIFHYYSNPDPDLGLWGADGEGIGGDYEFMILDYNAQEKCQILKGKKRGTYDYMYALPAGQSWPDYFKSIDAMDTFLLGGLKNSTPLDLYIGEKRLTLFNAKKHEFRVFEYAADTLGGGQYYGFIVTPSGIKLHDDEVLENKIGHAEFTLNATKDKLVMANNPNIYITMDPVDIFLDELNQKKSWYINAADLSDTRKDYINHIVTAIESKGTYSNVSIDRFTFTSNGSNALNVIVKWTYKTSSGTINTVEDKYQYIYSNSDNQMTLAKGKSNIKDMTLYKQAKTTQDGADNTILLMESFYGTYAIELVQGFAPMKGIRLNNADDYTKTFILKQ